MKRYKTHAMIFSLCVVIGLIGCKKENCKIPGCSDEVYSDGLCPYHYVELRNEDGAGVTESQADSSESDNPYYESLGLVGGNMDGEDNGYPTCFTLEQIKINLDNTLLADDVTYNDGIIAIKKGDLFYTTDFYAAIKDYDVEKSLRADSLFYRANIDNLYLNCCYMGLDNYSLPNIDYSKGDMIVFVGNSDELGVSFYRVSGLAYCFPMWAVLNYNGSGVVESFDCINLAWVEKAPNYSIEEINYKNNLGELFTKLSEYEDMSGRHHDIGVFYSSRQNLNDEPDVWTLGGYKGTDYIESEIKGEATFVALEPCEGGSLSDFNSSPKEYLSFVNASSEWLHEGKIDYPAKTRDGYFIMTSSTVNTLQPGGYMMDYNFITIQDY